MNWLCGDSRTMVGRSGGGYEIVYTWLAVGLWATRCKEGEIWHNLLWL